MIETVQALKSLSTEAMTGEEVVILRQSAILIRAAYMDAAVSVPFWIRRAIFRLSAEIEKRRIEFQETELYELEAIFAEIKSQESLIPPGSVETRIAELKKLLG